MFSQVLIVVQPVVGRWSKNGAVNPAVIGWSCVGVWVI